MNQDKSLTGEVQIRLSEYSSMIALWTSDGRRHLPLKRAGEGDFRRQGFVVYRSRIAVRFSPAFGKGKFISLTRKLPRIWCASIARCDWSG